MSRLNAIESPVARPRGAGRGDYHPAPGPRASSGHGAGGTGMGGETLQRGEDGATDGSPVRGTGQGEDGAGVGGEGGVATH